MTDSPLTDRFAEQCVVGSCMLRPQLTDAVAEIVTPEDFFFTDYRGLFAAIVDLRDRAEPIDTLTVGRRVAPDIDGIVLMDAIAAVPATGHAEKYARMVVAARRRRQVQSLAATASEGAQDPTVEVDALIERVQTTAASLDFVAGQLPADLTVFEELLTKPQDQRVPWVIPGLLRRDWRVVLVGTEGAGKTQVIQQIGFCAAQGLHPFAPEEPGSDYDPARVLFVDLENSEDRIVEGGRLVHRHVQNASGHFYDASRVWVWQRPAGINLRARGDVASLEAVLARVAPTLLCFGPLYKAASRERGEGWDEAALAVQRVLDRLRHRYGFALLMEDHAPQGSGGVRDLRPFGSALWLRWPELGLKLVPDEDDRKVLNLGRWRGDRMRNSWPDALERSEPWPWNGRWRNGYRPHVDEDPQGDRWQARMDLA